DVEQLKGGWISFEFKALESNITDNLLSEASELNYANVKVAGDIYDLSLKLVLGDGNELKLTTSTFTEPVTIKLKAGSTNPDRTGIFYVTDTVGLTYIDSTRTDDWLS